MPERHPIIFIAENDGERHFIVAARSRPREALTCMLQCHDEAHFKGGPSRGYWWDVVHPGTSIGDRAHVLAA